MNNLDQDTEAKLSAYAFGELSGDAKREVEALLKENPAAQEEVDELREFAGILKIELDGEPRTELEPARQAAVLESGRIVRKQDAFSKFSKGIGLLAVAACLCLLTVVGMRKLMKADVSNAPVLSESRVVVEIAEKQKELESARIEMLDAMENYDIVDVAKDEPKWMRGGEPGNDAIRAESVKTAPEYIEAKKKYEVAKSELSKHQYASPPADSMPPKAPSAPEPASPFEREVASPVAESVVPQNAIASSAEPLAAKELVTASEPDASAPALRRVTLPPLTRSAGKAGEELMGGISFGKGFGSGGFGDGGGGGGFGDKDESPPMEDFSRVTGRDKVSPNEEYGKLVDNAFKQAIQEPLSTFSIDVDTGSYSNIRRMVTKQNALPPVDAVRIEEMINYFDYKYPQPDNDRPFSVNVEMADCPWAPEYRLVKVGLKGKEMHINERPNSNLVFLIDVSGSMDDPDKLPLLKQSMIALSRKLGKNDSLGIVVYAGNSGVVLEPTRCDERKTVEAALERLSAGGSTNGGAGIKKAYALAKDHFIEGGVNRVILATDGDFNVGMTDTDDLITMVEEKAREDGIFLTVLGFGDGNLKESRMEQIADKGNGNYFYIDSAKEGRRVLVERLSSTLVAIAKDVKIQVDFNPGMVADYRLIGYANRMLKAEDFRDDTKDAGEIGAGHTVTALYQVLPASSDRAKALAEAHKSKYIAEEKVADPAEEIQLVESKELLTVKLRYKLPDEDSSVEFELPVVDSEAKWQESSEDFRFAAAVAGYGMLLRESEYKGQLSYKMVRELAEEGKGKDDSGLRQEFIDIVGRTEALRGER